MNKTAPMPIPIKGIIITYKNFPMKHFNLLREHLPERVLKLSEDFQIYFKKTEFFGTSNQTSCNFDAHSRKDS